MSGFRRFRSTLHRRRRSIEAVELGHLQAGPRTVAGLAPGSPVGKETAGRSQGEPGDAPLDFSPSREAREIGPAPIAWMKTRKPGLDH